MSERPLDPRLPRGRHNLPRAWIVASQRERLIAAAAAVFAERGFVQITSRQIVHAAAVSSSAFYEHFGSMPALFQAAFQLAAGSFAERIEAGCKLGSEPPEGIESAVEGGLEFLRAEPAFAVLLGLDLLVAQPQIAAERQALVEGLAALLRANSESGAAHRRRAAVADMLVNAALSTALERAKDGPLLPGLGAELSLLLGAAPT